MPDDNVTRKKLTATQRACQWVSENPERAAETRRKWVSENRAKLSEYHKEWRKQNKEKVVKDHSDYYEQNKDHVLRKSKDWRRNNKDKKAATYKIWVTRNPDKRRAILRKWQSSAKARLVHRKWARKNLDKLAAKSRNYRSKKLGNDGWHTELDVADIWIKQNKRCAVIACGFPISESGTNKFHVDHIHAVSLGGSNGPENLQILCRTHNLQKGAMDASEWAKRHGEPLAWAWKTIKVKEGGQL